MKTAKEKLLLVFILLKSLDIYTFLISLTNHKTTHTKIVNFSVKFTSIVTKSSRPDVAKIRI